MPTVLRDGPYRVYFYSHEPDEPPHVHVERDRSTAKFWLRPVRLARSLGFPGHELTRIRAMLEAHEFQLEEAWNDFFSS